MQMYRTGNLLQFFTKTSYSTSRSSSSHNIIEHLKNRALLKVSGNETADYLQGLITNDVRHIERGGCMYSMFLNTKGRVLYDTIIYKTEEVGTYLIECDIEVIASLEKHLKIYKLRRKINITSLLQNCNIYALFNPELARLNVKGVEVSNKNLDGTEVNTKTYKELLMYRDPRMSLLGSRIISPKDTDVKTNISEICTLENNPKPEETYKWLRYTLGVGEGVKDLPPGNCFPLEANCDYLHGVSFHKGCYIGQELTARTHHTGVVRKRLMPLLFSKVPGKMPESETVMHGDVNLGKLRGIEGDAGLGLLRVAKCLDLKEINIGNGVARTLRPTWWPVEASKEKIVQRNE